MRLYLLRHGIAADRLPGASDFDRKLTPEGIDEMRAVARGMDALDLKLHAIVSSPLVRARETAEIVGERLGLSITLDERIASGHGFSDVRELLAERDGRDLLLVGHEPDLSEDIRALTGGSVRMKKASLASLDIHSAAPGGGCLRWLLEARHLARLR